MKYRDSGESMPIPGILLKRSQSPKCWPDFAQDLDFEPSARRHSTEISQHPFCRNPTSSRCAACARPRHQLDLCRIMPRPCISARSSADCCANYSAQLFHPVEVSISQARSPNAVPRRHASPGTRKRLDWRRAHAAHWLGKHPNLLAIRVLSVAF
jgi:hypothetical protein